MALQMRGSRPMFSSSVSDPNIEQGTPSTKLISERDPKASYGTTLRAAVQRDAELIAQRFAPGRFGSLDRES